MGVDGGRGRRAAALISVLSQGGPRVLATHEIPICITGTVVTRFHGSRAAGCAARGLCGYRGSVTWRPRGGELLATEYATHAGRTWKTVLVLNDGPPHAAVARTAGSRVVATCRDQGVTPLTFHETPVRHDRATIGLASGGTNEWHERCAGPVHASLPPLPAAQLPFQAMLRGVAGTTIARRQRFAGGGFAGTVSEHLSYSAGPARRDHTGGPGSPPAVKHERVVTVHFRAAFTSAAFGVDWSHARAGCSALDACGLHGSERLGMVHRRAGTLDLDAYGPTDRPERDFLTALGVERGGNPHGIVLNGLDVPGGPIRTTAVTEQAGARCRGTGGGRLGLYASADGRLSFHALSFGATDLLRTSCPGPVMGSGQLAVARPAPGAFAARRVTLRFPSAQHALEDGEFEMQVHPRLGIALTRTGVSNRVVTYAAGGVGADPARR